MKKVFSLMAAFAMMITLSACGSKEQTECTPEVIEKEVITENIITKDVIKEVEVPVEVPGEFDYVQQYQPGTYFKATEADENGVKTFATVVVDKYGRIAGVKIDNTKVTNKYKIDEENDKLYIYVPGVEDVIPNAYRLVDLSKDKLPTIEDGFTVEDLIEGYPLHDAKIKTLKDVNANETQQIVDKGRANTWSASMDALAARIVKDQTTFGINLFESGKDLMTNSVEGVKHPVGKEIELVQSILDNEAKLGKDVVLAEKPSAKQGLYNEGSYYVVGAPQVTKNGVIYNTSFVVIDDLGQIAGLRLDETYNQNGLSTTKWVLSEDYGMKNSSAIGKEWFEQVEALEDAIVRNQTINGFKFVDANGANLASDKVYERANSGVEFKNPATLSNLSGTSIKVNGLLDAVKEALTGKINVTLVPGTYYNTDKNGNMMSITIAPNKDGKNIIIGMTLDSLHQTNQAYITIDGEDFELYVYDKGSLDLSLEEVKTPTLIYRDGDTYRYAENEDSADRKAIKVGDVVKFDYSGYDEKATVKAVEANKTKQTLKDRYGMAVEEGQLEWYEQANAYTNAFIGKDTAYVLNMLENETTDSLAGVTIKVSEYNKLVVDTLLKATDKDNAKSHIITDPAILTSLQNKLGSYVLANGSYYATSDMPNAEGGFYTYTMVVYDNKIISVAIDETINVNGVWTTKASLGKEYKVDKDFKHVEKDGVAYASQIASVFARELEENVNQLDGQKQLLERYSYEIDGELEKRADFFKEDSAVMAWNDAAEKVLLEALKNRVDEVMQAVADSVEKQIKDGKVVASDPASAGALKIEIDSLKLDKKADSKNVVEFDIEELSKTVKVSGRDLDYTIEADAEDILTSTTAKIKFTVEYDDYKPITREVEVKVQSVRDFKQAALDSTFKGQQANKFLGDLTSNELVSGQEIELKVSKFDQFGNRVAFSTLADKLGTVDTNPEVKWMIKSAENLMLSKKLDQNITVKYDGRDFYLVPNGPQSSITLDKPYNFTAISAETKVSALKLSQGTATELNAALMSFLTQDASKSANKIMVEVVNAKGITSGNVVVRAFFDDYDQDARDGKLGTYQKGEAYRDFTMTVYTKEQATKLAKERTSVGNILDTVTSEGQVIDLTVDTDLKLNDVTLWWNGTYSNKGSQASTTEIEYVEILKDKAGKEYRVYPVSVNGSTDYVALNKEKTGFVKVKLDSNNNVQEITNEAYKFVDAKTLFGWVNVGSTATSIAQKALALATDGFQFVTSADYKTGESSRRLEVKITNDNSTRVNLTATYYNGSNEINGAGDASKLKAEFIVAKASNGQYADRIVDSIKDRLGKEIKLNPFVDVDALTSAPEYEKPLPTELEELVIEGNKTTDKLTVQLKWFYEDGREVRSGHLGSTGMPSLGQVLASQVSGLEAGEKANTKLSVVATYEVDGVDKEVKVNFNTTVYKN